MNQNFHAALRQVQDLAVIDLQGEINAFASQELLDVYVQAESSSSKTILLNFEQVSYINSTGIAIIVELLKKGRLSQRQITACNLSEHYQEIFEITRLTEYIKIFPDEKAALLAETKKMGKN